MNKVSEKEAADMTVNERLWALGLMNEFDKAIKDNDEDRFREICERVFLTEENIAVLLDKYFGD